MPHVPQASSGWMGSGMATLRAIPKGLQPKRLSTGGRKSWQNKVTWGYHQIEADGISQEVIWRGNHLSQEPGQVEISEEFTNVCHERVSIWIPSVREYSQLHRVVKASCFTSYPSSVPGPEGTKGSKNVCLQGERKDNERAEYPTPSFPTAGLNPWVNSKLASRRRLNWMKDLDFDVRLTCSYWLKIGIVPLSQNDCKRLASASHIIQFWEMESWYSIQGQRWEKNNAIMPAEYICNDSIIYINWYTLALYILKEIRVDQQRWALSLRWI